MKTENIPGYREIKIKGRKLPFKAGAEALVSMLEKNETYKKSVGQFFVDLAKNKVDIKDLNLLVYYCFYHGCRYKGVDKISYQDFTKNILPNIPDITNLIADALEQAGQELIIKGNLGLDNEKNFKNN